MFGAARTSQSLQTPAGLSSEADRLLGTSVCRALCDKQYDRRKAAALQIEQQVRNILQQFDERAAYEKASQILAVLVREFLDNPQASIRKGGLIGLANCAIALERNVVQHQDTIVPPVVKCFSDLEPRVRYYACESLYNIAKVARADILVYFEGIFDGLCKICADVDMEVKHGSEYLDRLLKELLTQAPNFKGESIVEFVGAKVKAVNPHIRQLVLSWILTLNNMASVDIAVEAPSFLEGIFVMLSDANKDVRQAVQNCLVELLLAIKKSDVARQPVYARDVAAIVVKFARSADPTSRFTSLCWLNELIVASEPRSVSPPSEHVSNSEAVPQPENQDVVKAAVALRSSNELQILLPLLLGAVLDNIDDSDEDIHNLAYNLHTSLFLAVYDVSSDETFFSDKLGSLKEATARRAGILLNCDVSKSLPDLVAILFSKLTQSLDKVSLRSVCLQWMSLLLHQKPQAMQQFLEQLLDPLFDTLDDTDPHVASDALRLLALASSQGKLLPVVVQRLIRWFTRGQNLLAERGRLVIRQLACLLDAKKFYATVGRQILEETDLNSAHELVHIFNWTLLTAKETRALREELLSDDSSFLQMLIVPWFHNAVSTLALALWCNEVDLALGVIERLSRIEPSPEFLVQLDELVHLIGSPSFSRVRLLALDIKNHPKISKVLMGISMLLPPAAAYRSLQHRLQVIQLSCMVDSISGVPGSAESEVSVHEASGTRQTIAYEARPDQAVPMARTPSATLGSMAASGSSRIKQMTTTELLAEFEATLRKHEEFVPKNERGVPSSAVGVLTNAAKFVDCVEVPDAEVSVNEAQHQPVIASPGSPPADAPTTSSSAEVDSPTRSTLRPSKSAAGRASS